MFPRRLFPLALTLVLCGLGFAQSAREIAMLEIPGKPGFDGMAVVRGMLLMSHAGAGTVDIFDPVKRRLIAHVKGMSDPRGIAVDEDGGKIYIANRGANNIVVLSARDWQVEATIPVRGSPTGLFFIPAWGILAAADPYNGQLIVVDMHGHQQPTTIPMPGSPRAMAFDNARGLLCVTLQDARQVIALNRQLEVSRRMTFFASQPTGIVYDRKLDRLYVAVRYAVLSVNPNDGAELSRVPADGGIDQLWLDEDSRMLYGAAGGSLLVMRADSRLHVLAELQTDVKGYSVAYDPERKLVFFPGGREGRSKLLLLKAPGEALTKDANAEATLR